MIKPDFNGKDILKKIKDEPGTAYLFTEYLDDIDYSDLNLNGLSLEEINKLGMDYEYGENGKEADSLTAKKYYTAAAEMGFINSQLNLAGIHRQDSLPNYTKAMYWHKKAADAGDAQAKYLVGAMYHEGEGVKRDYNEALKWYKQAVDGGYMYAWYVIGLVYNNDYDEGAPTDHVKAVECFKKAVKAGIDEGYYFLGIAHLDGKYVPLDLHEAFSCFEKACNTGIPYALKEIDEMFENGDVKNSKYKSVSQWYADLNDGGKLARNYAHIIREEDEEDVSLFEKSAFWYEQAVKKGDKNAFYQLVLIYNFYKENNENKGPGRKKMAEYAKKFYPREKKASHNNKEKDECEKLIREITKISVYEKKNSIFGINSIINDDMNDLLKIGLSLVSDAIDHEISVSILDLISDENKLSEKIIIEGVDCLQKGVYPSNVKDVLCEIYGEEIEVNIPL